MKYVIKNVVYCNGKIVIFMFKLIVGDNGSGMYVYQLLFKGGVNLFFGDGYGGLLQMVLWYIGGIFKYVKVINVFINVGINSYKCLVLGFEVLVMLVYLVCNCLVLCCILWVFNLKVCCIEMCFFDLIQFGYLIFIVLMMVGLDGIWNQIDLGVLSDKDLYDLLLEEEKLILQVCFLLDQVLEVLDKDCEFFKVGGVMSDDFIDGYIVLKMQEVICFCVVIYLFEYQMYYVN